MQEYPILVGGETITTPDKAMVQNKFDYSPYATVCLAGEEHADQAVALARQAVSSGEMNIPKRYDVLSKTARLLVERQDELAEILIQETGKTVVDARNEVLWSADLFTEAAEEAKRLTGETVCFPVPWLEEQLCYTRKEPVGIVVAITPFNYPLNLVAHKVAPALGAGNAVIIKPSSYNPVIAYQLCQLLLEAGLPKGYISCLMGSGAQVGGRLVANEDVDYYSFTGSVQAGKTIQAGIGLRQSAMELGSNAATIVCDDYDVEAAAAACAEAAFTNAGQVCIHLQRLFVQQSIYEAFVQRLVQEANAKVVGDPSLPQTQIGPMIAEGEAKRVIAWVEEAVEQGAKLLCGGTRENALVAPTVLENVSNTMKVMKDEVFGPVVSVVPFDTLDQAIAMVNDSRYGLNAGVLTKHISNAKKAVAGIDTGSVIIGGTCGFRFGNMPYGGVKESGFGKEGPRYAMEEMSKTKTIVVLD